MNYFRKYDPHIQISDGLGRKVPFQDLGNGWGVLVTQDSYLIGQLKRAIAEQRGGVEEMTADEHRDFLKKKTTPPFSRVYRESLGHQSLKRMIARVNAATAAEGKLPPHIRSQLDNAKQLTRPVGKSDLVVRGVAR